MSRDALQPKQRALKLFGDFVCADEPMSRHTSFRVGGPAMLFASPNDVEALRRLLDFCAAEGLPWFVLGYGTNLLVSDQGYSGMVLHLRRGWDDVRIRDNVVEAGAGTSLPALARKVAGAGLGGLEFAAGIPGSAGGATAMNAGAFGGDMAQVAAEVECVTEDGALQRLSNSEVQFGYRTSRIVAERLIVTKVHLLLKLKPSAEILQKMEEFQAQRRARQPLRAWSAGSVFRNPPGDAAGRLLEAAGCKGLREGGALISPKHANFIVNTGTATAEEIAALMTRARRRVWDRFGIRLQPEITLLGPFEDTRLASQTV